MIEEIIKLNIAKTEAEELIKVSNNIEKDINKLKKGYPIQYLIGYSNFYGYKIEINKNVLIPRFETELLVEKSLNYIKKFKIKNPLILDLCTGSGAISVAIGKNLNCELFASDIDSKCLKLAKKNIKINNLNIKLIKSNLYKNIIGKFDIIISNPPYISKKENIEDIVKNNEPKKALFSKKKGTYHIKKIILESSKYLNEKSLIALEIGSLQEKELEEFCKKINIKNFVFEKDLTGKTRYLFIFNNIE